MFKTLYRCPRTVARHENGPLHESRRRYLEHVAAQGAALHTLRAAAGTIYRAAIWMKLDESSPVKLKEVERAAKRWAHRSYRNASCRSPEQTDKEFRQTTCAWLLAAIVTSQVAGAWLDYVLCRGWSLLTPSDAVQSDIVPTEVSPSTL